MWGQFMQQDDRTLNMSKFQTIRRGVSKANPI